MNRRQFLAFLLSPWLSQWAIAETVEKEKDTEKLKKQVKDIFSEILWVINQTNLYHADPRNNAGLSLIDVVDKNWRLELMDDSDSWIKMSHPKSYNRELYFTKWLAQESREMIAWVLLYSLTRYFFRDEANKQTRIELAESLISRSPTLTQLIGTYNYRTLNIIESPEMTIFLSNSK